MRRHNLIIELNKTGEPAHYTMYDRFFNTYRTNQKIRIDTVLEYNEYNIERAEVSLDADITIQFEEEVANDSTFM